VTEALLAGLLGLLIGSFLNVCIYRLPRDKSVVAPRSHCPNCEHLVAWYDNIPILSFVLLGGRCRKCRALISWRYPLVEVLTAVLFFGGVLMLGLTLSALKFCAFAAIQVALIFTDVEERILPDEFTLGGTAAGLAISAFVPLPASFFSMMSPESWSWRAVSVGEAIFSAVFLSVVLWGIGAAYYRIRGREGLGLGDVKMIAMIAAFLGLGGALITLAIGSVLGTVSGLAYIYIAGKDPKTYELPFGTFLGLAALIVSIQTGAATLAAY
jgi:leader peptidase (prepilin peptidase)/N-methyltransferase